MKKNRLFHVLFALIILLDQTIKVLLLKGLLPIGEVIYSSEQNMVISIIVPLLAVLILLLTLKRVKSYTNIERGALWALSAGVVTNCIDRIFRSLKVIDYISIENLQFLPTLNIGDITVVISTTIVILSIIIQDRSS
jgi:lipoprotein signal peptidase